LDGVTPTAAIELHGERLSVVDTADREAFDAFARARTPALLRFAHVLTGDPEKAADLVQDALERTIMAWPRVVRKDDPEGYVRRAIVHRNVSIWRRLKRETLVGDVPESSYVPTDPHDAALWATLAELPPRMRAVVVLRFYEDLGEAQTAAVLGCSVGTVKSTTSRALVRLREKLAAQEQEGTWTA
jgi:RNA polymerase sigma-70 factor (sigma-E family)